jgi:hypothetical protein
MNDWEFSIYAYIVYLSYNIRFFVYFSYSRILGNGGGPDLRDDKSDRSQTIVNATLYLQGVMLKRRI